MNRSQFQNLGILLTVCVLAGACATKPVRVEPKFTGRLLVLAGNNPDGADLIEVTPGANSTYNYSKITGGVFEAVASPDRTQLLYTTKDEILLRDLHSGAVKSLIKGENCCLAWSTDGKSFSYKQKPTAGDSRTKFYVADLNAKTKLIWEDPLTAADRAASACAHWIAPDRLIFDRFLGALPPQNKSGEGLKPNTTTLAILTDSVKLVDSERKWSIESICPVGTAAFVRPHDQDQPILIAKSLDQLKTLNPTPAPCSGCRFVGFAAKSCVPFFLEDSTSNSSELFSLNPINWQRQKSAHVGQTFSVTARMLVNSAARLMVVGDMPSSLWLVDTESGDIVSFFPQSGQQPSGGPLLSPQPIVWIE
jgi:hypothetical protein